MIDKVGDGLADDPARDGEETAKETLMGAMCGANGSKAPASGG